MKYLPTDAFGVFTTVRRGQKLKVWPTDIHGCIGHWEATFEPLAPKELYDNLLRVSYDAVWTDERRHHFPLSLVQDSLESYVEVDFMLKPLYVIETHTGCITELGGRFFTNDKYGLLIQSKSSKRRATFLPNVFDKDTPWKTILADICHKANIKSDFDVYAYSITQVKAPLTHLLTHKTFAYANLYVFTRLILQTLNVKNEDEDDPDPLFARTKNSMLQWSVADNVRNTATISEVLKYAALFPSLRRVYKKELAMLRQKIVKNLNSLNLEGQALSFLGSYVSAPVAERYCKKLHRDFLVSKDANFAQPEIVIGLQRAKCVGAEELRKRLTFNTNDSIFKMNWVIQAYYAATAIIPQQLVNMLVEKVKKTILLKSNIETNYLAVAFEALCFVYVYHYCHPRYNVMALMFELLFNLELRKQEAGDLYAFLDKGARVDITGHVNNGLYVLFVG